MAILGKTGYAVDTTLVTGVSATNTTAYLASFVNWPDGSNDRFIIQVDSEYLLISRRVGNTLTIAQRGYNGTTPAVHAAAATVTVLGYETIRTAFDAPGFLATLSPASGATGLATFENTPSSANFAALITDESGTGAVVLNTGPTITLPLINNEILGYTTIATAAGTTTLTVNSNQKNFFTGSTIQTVVLPVASTLTLGQSFYVRNNSTGIITVQSSGGNTILAMPSNTRAMFTCILTSATDTTSWSSSYVGFAAITGTGSVVLGTSPTIATPTITGVLTSGGTDTSSGAAVTSPTVTSGVAFTPSTTTNSEVIFQLAGVTGSYTITFGPTTGAENTIANAVPTLLNVGDVVPFMVPKGWKVVLTLTTVTLTQTRVISF